MTKINLILPVKRFYILSVSKITCTLQVIFNEDAFLKFIRKAIYKMYADAMNDDHAKCEGTESVIK